MEFPIAFEKRVQQDSFLGQELLNALNSETPTSIRLHPTKKITVFPESTSIPWSKNGRWLKSRPQFTLDPRFHGGAYYPQEAGSQFLDAIVQQLELPENPVVLDLCAAPGGKSTLLLAALPENALLISNEIIPNRAKILKENLTKWGSVNNLVTNNAPEDFQVFPETFDLIVVDAPCSGEGMFRKDLQAREEWSEENVEKCAIRQQDILSDIWPSLKPGGLLVYSTCTFNSSENENNLNWLSNELEANYIPLQLEQAIPGRNNIGFYAIPGKLDTEGFYIAAIQKPIDKVSSLREKKMKAKTTVIIDKTKVEALADLHEKTVLQWNNYLFAIPTVHLALIQRVHAQLRVIKLGTEIGEIGPKGIIPNSALALDLSTLNSDVSIINLTLEQALKYLKGETFPLAGDRGYSVVQFEGINLGWINHLGNRFNNLYPKEWRIRMRID